MTNWRFGMRHRTQFNTAALPYIPPPLITLDFQNGRYWAQGLGDITVDQAVMQDGNIASFDPTVDIIAGKGLVRSNTIPGFRRGPVLTPALYSLISNGFTAVVSGSIPSLVNNESALMSCNWRGDAGVAPYLECRSGWYNTKFLTDIYGFDQNFGENVHIQDAMQTVMPQRYAFTTNDDGSIVALSAAGRQPVTGNGGTNQPGMTAIFISIYLDTADDTAMPAIEEVMFYPPVDPSVLPFLSSE